MPVNAKHLATFILGAAAGVAAHKFLQTEEGEKLMEDLKAKGTQLKDEAESAVEKAPEYFEKLKTEASGAFNELISSLKEKYPDAEKTIQDLMNGILKSNQPK